MIVNLRWSIHDFPFSSFNDAAVCGFVSKFELQQPKNVSSTDKGQIIEGNSAEACEKVGREISMSGVYAKVGRRIATKRKGNSKLPIVAVNLLPSRNRRIFWCFAFLLRRCPRDLPFLKNCRSSFCVSVVVVVVAFFRIFGTGTGKSGAERTKRIKQTVDCQQSH